MKSLLLSSSLVLSLISNSYGAGMYPKDLYFFLPPSYSHAKNLSKLTPYPLQTAIDISARSPLPNPILDSRACPNYKTVSHIFQPDDVVISRAKTRQLQNQLNTLTTAAEICAVLFGLATVEGAIPCAIWAIETNFYANKAGECTGKNQCLEMKWKIIPECVGGSNCC
jgi:hypothetical protein